MIYWITSTDKLYISVPALKSLKMTVASDLAKVFDVLGLFAPSLFQAKIFIQQLWLTGLGWDYPVPTIIKKEWNRWANELPEFATYPFSRLYYHVMKSVFSRELHGFAGSDMLVLLKLD